MVMFGRITSSFVKVSFDAELHMPVLTFRDHALGSSRAVDANRHSNDRPEDAMINRRAWLAGAVASSAGLTRRAHAQTYPSRVIKMIVPFAPGGPADTMARLAAQQLSTRLGQSVIIDNRGGAGGTIAAKAAAGAEPDGYTLMFGNTATFAVGPAVYANIGYDPLKNFAPIALFSTSTNLLVTDPKLPVRSVPELIAYAKTNPGK